LSQPELLPALRSSAEGFHENRHRPGEPVELPRYEAQRAGFIQYTHGTIRIVNRSGLVVAVCECYAVARKQFDGFLRATSPDADGEYTMRCSIHEA
jgi:hypothetical protein